MCIKAVSPNLCRALFILVWPESKVGKDCTTLESIFITCAWTLVRESILYIFYHSKDIEFRCWVMFMVFHKRHYDKALLVILSAFMYWEKNNHPMYNVIQQPLVAFDEYPIEKFHSVLRGRTNATDDANQISLKA